MSKNNKNKNVRVVQSNYDVELKINNFSEKFNVSHKMTKKDKLEITIKDKIKTFKLSLKETKSKIKVKQIKIVEKIENKSKETLVSLDKIEYVDDFEIKVRDFYVPVTVLINPVLELYYDIEKINTEMKPNKSRMKMKKNRYVIDCSIKKEDYIVESSALSVEELEELYKEDEDNQLGVYLEYLKRRHEQEDEVEETICNEIKDVINEYQNEIDKLNEKQKKEREELNKKINEKIKDKKEKYTSKKEKKEERVPLVDLICSVFEDCGKKDVFMKAYDKGKEEMIKVTKELISEKPELKDVIIKMLDIKIEQNDEADLAKEFKENILSKKKNKKDFNRKKTEIDVKDLAKYFKETLDTIFVS